MTVAPHPRAKAGCKACAQSVSGVCVAHAAVSVDGHARQCVAIKQDGTRCQRWGTQVSEPPKCPAHQDDQEAADRAKILPGQGNARRRRAQRATTDALDLLGQEDKDIDSLEELEALAAEALAFKDFLREQAKLAIINNDSGEEKQIARYVTALDRCGKLLETFAKQGLAEREIKMREELVGIVSGLFNSVLASFIPVENQAEAQGALGAAISALEPPRALTA